MNNSIRTIPWLKYAQLMILALQHNSSSSQHPCALVDKHACPGYIEPQHRLSMWFSLYSDCHRSAVSPSSDSLKRFPSVPTAFPRCRVSPLLQLPNPWVEVHSCSLSSFFSLLSFILPSYSWIRIILSSGQGLLLVFSWCSIASVDIFLTHSWSKRHSTSTYPPSWLLLPD